MEVENLVAPASVLVGVRASDKRKVLEGLAERGAALADLEPGAVLEALLRREELGSTGMGEGAAIPHARLPGVARPVGLFARLKSAVDWQAINDRPVDLVCLLAVGVKAEHLEARQAPLGQAGPIAVDRALLGRIAHRRLLLCPAI